MKIYGCDFSGARDPESKIFVTVGELREHRLEICEISHCEERLDLFQYIVESKAAWGLDFPFSIPENYLRKFFEGSWETYIHAPYDRKSFLERFGRIRHSAKDRSIFRETDLAVQGKSPISSTPIAMLNMLYGGRKLLKYLLKMKQACIYPFTELNLQVSRVYEVYPSHTWQVMNISRKHYTLRQISDWFGERDFRVTFPRALEGAPLTEDQSDSLIACVTMGYCIWKYSVDSDWNRKPVFATDAEWQKRSAEGITLRIN